MSEPASSRGQAHDPDLDENGDPAAEGRLGDGHRQSAFTGIMAGEDQARLDRLMNAGKRLLGSVDLHLGNVTACKPEVQRQVRTAEFILGIEPRKDKQTHLAWFRLDCDGADKEHQQCEEAGRSGKTEIWGTLGTRSSAVFDLDEDGDLDIVTLGVGSHLKLIGLLPGRRDLAPTVRSMMDGPRHYLTYGQYAKHREKIIVNA